MRIVLLAGVAASITSVAGANVIQSVTQHPGLAHNVFGTAPTHGAEAVTGDTVNVAITAFTPSAGGAILVGPGVHTAGGVNAVNSVAPALIANTTITSTVTTVGTTRTVSILWIADLAPFNGAIAQPGLGVGGQQFTSIFFEMPGNNAGANLWDDAQKIGPATGTFNLLDNLGASIFGTAAGITDSGTSFNISNGVNAGGTPIFNFPIGGGTWTVSYEIIPAPGAFALLGLGGLAAARRRR